MRTISRTTLAEQVALQVAQLISQECWKVGERLPSESVLCKNLNVGRSTLREALKSLAFIGLVRVRAGDGTYVSKNPVRPLDEVFKLGLLKNERDLEEVREARILLETEMTALAAVRMTKEDGAKLSAIARELEESLDGKGRPYNEIDLDFHLAIADASHNRILARLLADIGDVLKEWMSKSQEFPGGLESAHMYHNRLLNFLLTGDAENARRTMRQHLETFQKAYKLVTSNK